MIAKEFRYQNSDAGEVELAWGIDGWAQLPEEMLPAETTYKNNIMHTLMGHEGDDFTATVSVPSGASIDYGFLVTKNKSGELTEEWYGGYRVAADTDDVVADHILVEDSPAVSGGGKDLFLANCSVCHGRGGEGVAGLGKDLVDSEFMEEISDEELGDFIIAGRPIEDPLNTTGVLMPPYGGNPSLTEGDIASIVAYMRSNAEAGQLVAGDFVLPESQIEPAVVEGFTIETYINIPGEYLTSLEFGPDGALYVLSYGGTLMKITDTDGDGKGDEPQIIRDDFVLPTGLAWLDGELYVASQGEIIALRDPDFDGQMDEERLVVSDLPAGFFPVHANNDLTFGPDGRLYFGVGSTSNASPETLEYAASILSINPDGSDLQVVATGLRNVYEVAFNAAGDMFAGDNSPDGETADLLLPPDEFNHIVQDSDYGFPNYFGPPDIGSGTMGPLYNFPVHSAPSGLLFYSADQFPQEYVGDAFIALWTLGQVYRMQIAQTAGGDYVAHGSVFASGLPGIADVAVGPDGSMYISTSDDFTIYRVAYNP